MVFLSDDEEALDNALFYYNGRAIVDSVSPPIPAMMTASASPGPTPARPSPSTSRTRWESPRLGDRRAVRGGGGVAMDKLDPRLALIYQMVPPCRRAADVGTDHGYLICALVEW